MKKIITIGGIIVIAIVALVFFVVIQKPGTPSSSGSGASSTGTLPPVATTTVAFQYPTGPTLQLGTSAGSVTVNNFYNNPVQVSQDHTSIVTARSSTYNITYYRPDSSFNIGILTGPVPAVRAQAEAAFLAELGISKTDACKLNVMIGVPYDVDPNYADQNLGLSFCSASSSAFQE